MCGVAVPPLRAPSPGRYGHPKRREHGPGPIARVPVSLHGESLHDKTTDATASTTAVSMERLVSLQHPNGSWEAEVVWSPIITAQAVIVQAIVGQPASPERSSLILQHFRRTRRLGGGWGLHPESRAYVFVTTVVYIAARLLQAPADDPMLREARDFLAQQKGGVLSNPQWGRFWLALVGLYDWDDLNACPPELFLLPESSAFSPLSFYCHTRYIYLAMAYLSGRRFAADLGPVTALLRRELPGLEPRPRAAHPVPVASSDLHEEPGRALRLSNAATRALAPLRHALPGAGALRRRALDAALTRIKSELRASGYQSLSPVSGFLDILALFDADPNDPEIASALAGAEFWCWCDPEDGLRYAGARSISWDTSFVLQTLLTMRGDPRFPVEAIRRGYRALCAMQASDDPPDRIKEARDINRGGWSFTDGTQAWPVSDCTAEAVLGILDCHAAPELIPAGLRIAPQRLADAADFILSRQNPDGGFGSYERRRGARFLEDLNPSEMFGRCMTELTYVECTASAIRALRRVLTETDAPVDRGKLQDAVRRGTAIILARQNPDGSWPGFWGINFVYGTLFALKALRGVGVDVGNPAIDRARRWLESKQKADGGWGEHFSGCATGQFVDDPRSLVISTAWATLALLQTSEQPPESARRGAAWLVRHRKPDGDWPRDSVNGVFFGTAMLDYRLYNTYFPLMALAELNAHVGA